LIHHKKTHKDIFIEYGGLMVSFENRLIGFDIKSGIPFYYWDYSERSQLHRFGKIGLGPTDFITPFSAQYIDENTLGIYDFNKKVFSELDICSDSIKTIVKKAISIENKQNFRLIKTAYNQHIGIGSYDEGMFLLMDSVGKNISYFFNYPYKDKDERQIENRLRSMAYQGYLLSNKKRDHFVYACGMGDILHFYRIKENEIEIIKKNEKIYPIYITEEVNGGFGAPMSTKNKIGYISGDATDEYVYLLRGNKSLEYFMKENKADEADHLVVYNWDGVLIKEIKLDIPCRYICVTPNNKKVWAIANIPEPSLVYFYLSGF
jgi:hypothetical protein